MNAEKDLSPKVQRYWEEQGYCVHGEVALHRSGIFIDHVAHLGPCDDPDYIVAIEMKKNAGKSLRTQIAKLDTFHVADELWGVAIATPTQKSIDLWTEHDRGDAPWWVTIRSHWISPGLMSWEEDEFVIHTESEILDDKNMHRRANHLLLVEENKGIEGGCTTAHQSKYSTHWSVSHGRLLEWIQEHGEAFSTKDVYERLPSPMDVYKKPKNMARAILNAMVEEGHLAKDGRDGRYNRYVLVEGDGE